MINKKNIEKMKINSINKNEKTENEINVYKI